MRFKPTETLDFDNVDRWAINLVVHEGVRMNLSYTEQIIAVSEMNRQRLRVQEMADRLRCSTTDVEAMLARARRMKRSVGSRA